MAWTKEEDESLKQFVENNGNKWSTYVAHFAPHRTAQHCRYRYTDILSPVMRKGPFDASEIEKLREGVREFGTGKWKDIQQKYLPHRPQRKIANVWSSQADPDLVQGEWTKEEDDLLHIGVSQYGQAWTKISKELLPHRSRQALRYRFVDALTDDVRHGTWSEEEQKMLLERVIMYGTNNWSRVAEEIAGRNEKMCKQTWYLKVDPSLYRGEWNEKESRIFWKLVEKEGKKWSVISAQLPGRSYQDCYLLFWRTVREELGLLAGPSYKRNYNDTWVRDFAKHVSEMLDPTRRIVRSVDGKIQEISIGKWSDDDITKLSDIVKKHTASNGITLWDNVAVHFPDRTKPQIRDRYRYQQRLEQGMEPFSADEDYKLATLVKAHGEKWHRVADEMEGRTSDDCKFRWSIYGKWKQDQDQKNGRQRLTDDEKDLIRQGVSMFRNDWVAISQTYLPHITPERCRNWWYGVGRHLDNPYSKEDIDRFLELAINAQEGDDEIDWLKVSHLVPTLTADRCKERWNALSNERNPWTPAETLALIEAAHKYRGNPNYERNVWAAVAEAVGNNRTRNQCAAKLFYMEKRRASDAKLSRLSK